MSEKYLGQPEPERAELTTPSLSKYKYAIDQWGGWALFQVCLHIVVIVSKNENPRLVSNNYFYQHCLETWITKPCSAIK